MGERTTHQSTGTKDAEELRLDQRVSRRAFLKIAGLAGATVGVGAGLGGALAACGTSTTTTTAAPATTTTAAPATTTTAAGTSTTVAAGPEVGREIKIGRPGPVTGPLANFGIADEWSTALGDQIMGDGVILGDGKKHKVTFLIRDTQSDSNRAAQIAGDLVLNEKVDMIVVSGTPDTNNPVADQCESLGCPMLAMFSPWQPYLFGRNRTPASEDKWTYGFFFGLEQEVIVQTQVFAKIPTNKKMGMLLANDTDGNAWAQALVPAFQAAGYDVTFPQQYTPGSEDFTAQISAFKKAGCEILSGTHLAPDFTNFWKQSLQQAFKPKIAYCGGKALENMKYIESIGDSGVGLLATWGIHRTCEYTDALTNMTVPALCENWEKATGLQWDGILATHAKATWAVDVLQRAKNPEDKESIVEAILGTKMETILGTLDFTQKVDPAGNRISKNICKTGWIILQVAKGANAKPTASTWPYEVNVVGVDQVKVEVFDPVAMQYS